jgi:proline dehydrogenase
MRKLLLWVSTNRWLAQRLPRLRFVQKAVTRFIPGEELDAALTESRAQNGRGIGTLLTLLGENVTTPEGAHDVRLEYLDDLEEIAARGLDTELSVKPTQLGMDLGADVVFEHLDAMATAASQRGNFVWIDIEGSAYKDATLELFRALRERHQNVGLCLQAYLFDTPDDLESLLPLAPAIRMVKGAYAEPDTIAYPKKKDVDRAFLQLAVRMLESEGRPVFGTHDEGLIQAIQSEANRLGVPGDRCEFHFLYGIAVGVQERLVREGGTVRVLISYGPAWFPWYVRRLAERPANLGFVLRKMAGL